MYLLVLILFGFFIYIFFRKYIVNIISFKVNKNIKSYYIYFLTTLLFLFILSYLKYDNEHYYYGRGCTFCNKNKIPYGVEPHGGAGFSFTLKDEDDFELVGIGFRYQRTDFIIKDFLAYGYSDTSIMVKCRDSIRNVRYLISYETKYRSNKGSLEISFEEINKVDFERIKDDYQWVRLYGGKEDAIQLMKLISITGVLFSLFFLYRLS